MSIRYALASLKPATYSIDSLVVRNRVIEGRLQAGDLTEAEEKFEEGKRRNMATAQSAHKVKFFVF